MAEGKITEKVEGDPSIYTKSLDYPGGQIIIYTNDSHSLNLKETLNFKMQGYKLHDHDD